MGLKIALRHRFPDFSVEVDFEAPGGVTVLYGPSGSGKSTILNAVTGLLSPDFARIEVDGRVLADTANSVMLPPHKRGLGVVFQQARLFPHLTVRQNLRYGRFFARKKRNAIPEAKIVDMLGIGAVMDRFPAGLSGGEQQRAAIGRALLSAPAMLIADEPLSALDDARKAEILPYLEMLPDELGISILYVTHSSIEVARLATTVVSLMAGRVLAVGSASDALSRPHLLQDHSDAAAVICGRILLHHADGITEIAVGEASIYLPRLDQAVGTRVRLRVAAQDVMLAHGRPEGLSALNVLSGRVEDVHEDGQGVLVRLHTPAGSILSRITARSAKRLAVTESAQFSVIVKSVSLTL